MIEDVDKEINTNSSFLTIISSKHEYLYLTEGFNNLGDAYSLIKLNEKSKVCYETAGYLYNRSRSYKGFEGMVKSALTHPKELTDYHKKYLRTLKELGLELMIDVKNLKEHTNY